MNQELIRLSSDINFQEENMNITHVKQELTDFLRNNDVLTITQRGVTTTTQEDTLTAEDTITIDKTTVKNVRSITVGAVSKVLGTDWTVDYKHANGCVITFEANQTGAYVVTYDYGSDSIFPDYPRDDLTINSYPRIAVDILSAPIDAFGIGGDTFISDVALTIVVYSNNSDDLDSYIQIIKDLIVSNAKTFYYLSFVKPILIGPTINSADKKDEIMQKNLDILGMFNVEGV